MNLFRTDNTGTTNAVETRAIANPDDTCEPEEEDGIRRFKIIGSKKFLYDPDTLEKHLAHVLQWWRGKRPPEGVPIDRAYRCR